MYLLDVTTTTESSATTAIMQVKIVNIVSIFAILVDSNIISKYILYKWKYIYMDIQYYSSNIKNQYKT